ncbi:MAG TPA: hypothetical protein VF945_14760 [Polyangia bacterium]
MPTTAHFIYIPVVLVIGIVIGFILGGRAARDAFAAQKEKEEARAARRAARGKPAAPSDGGPSSER